MNRKLAGLHRAIAAIDNLDRAQAQLRAALAVPGGRTEVLRLCPRHDFASERARAAYRWLCSIRHRQKGGSK